MLDFIATVISIALKIGAFICAILLLYCIYWLIKHHPFKQVHRGYLKRYLDNCIKEQDYAEAAYISEILKKNSAGTHVRLPLFLTIRQHTDFVEDNDSVFGIKRKKLKYIERRFGDYSKQIKLTKIIRVSGIIVIAALITVAMIWGIKKWQHHREQMAQETELRTCAEVLRRDTVLINMQLYLNLGLPLRVGQCIRDTVNSYVYLIKDSEDLKFYGRSYVSASFFELHLNQTEKLAVDSAMNHYHLVPLKIFREKGFYLTTGMKVFYPNSQRVQVVKDGQFVNWLNQEYLKLDSEYLQLAKVAGLERDVYKVVLDSTGYSQYLLSSKK